MASYFDYMLVTRYVRTVAKRAGLRVKIDDACKVPHTSRDELVLPACPKSDASAAELADYRHGAWHECMHHEQGRVSLNMLAAAKLGQSDQLFCMILNLVEDERIERGGTRLYPGDLKLCETAWPSLWNKGYDPLEAAKAQDDPAGAVLFAAQFVQIRMREGWMNTGGFADRIEPDITPETQKILDKWHSKGRFEQWRAMPVGNSYEGAAAAWNLAKDMLEDAMPDSKAPDAPDEAETANAGQEVNGKGKTRAEVEKGQQCEAGKTEGSAGQPVNAQVAAAAQCGATHGEESALGAKANNWSHGMRPWSAVSDPSVWDCRTRSCVAGDPAEFKSTHAAPRFEYDPGIGTAQFAAQVRRLLQIISTAHWHGGHKSGRVQAKSVWKAAVQAENPRVFKRREQANTLDTCVTVLVDVSGSMAGGGRFASAVEGSIMLAETARVLDFPLGIVAYTTGREYPNKPALYVVKHHDEKLDARRLGERFQQCTALNFTPTPNAVMWAWDWALDRPEKRKVQLLMTDGLPEIPTVAVVEATRQVLDEYASRPDQDLVVLGIGSRARGFLDRIRSKCYTEVASASSEIPAAMLRLLEKLLVQR